MGHNFVSELSQESQMHEFATTQIIDALSIALAGEDADLRQHYLTRQTLLALVRQAKAETLLDMRANVARLTGMDAMALRRRHTKAILKGIALGCDARQQQFEFDRGDKPA
jgi:hypothetical protein